MIRSLILLLLAGYAVGQTSPTTPGIARRPTCKGKDGTPACYVAVDPAPELKSFMLTGCPKGSEKDVAFILGTDKADALAKSGCRVLTVEEYLAEHEVLATTSTSSLIPNCSEAKENQACFVEPDPSDLMDVPAIRPMIDGENNGMFCSCPKNTVSAGICAENTLPKCFKAWTCADKSRILMTSEDGKRWCHKVQP